MQNLSVIKIGGSILDHPDRKADFLQQFAALPGAKILVHGGGKIATEIGNKLGIESRYVNGRRITDEPTLDLVTMVYGGLINKSIVAQLQAVNCNAIGLSGCDGNVITANKRPVREVDYGFVGDVKSDGVNSDLLNALLNVGLIPVLTPLTHDGHGYMLNTNADTIAQEVAQAMSVRYKVELIYCFEKKGVLKNTSDETSVIRNIDAANFNELVASGIINNGMIPKLENAFTAIQKGVQKVIIGSAENLPALIANQSGTCIQ